jgi:hypothetical protein
VSNAWSRFFDNMTEREIFDALREIGGTGTFDDLYRHVTTKGAPTYDEGDEVGCTFPFPQCPGCGVDEDDYHLSGCLEVAAFHRGVFTLPGSRRVDMAIARGNQA